MLKATGGGSFAGGSSSSRVLFIKPLLLLVELAGLSLIDSLDSRDTGDGAAWTEEALLSSFEEILDCLMSSSVTSLSAQN